MARSNGRAVAVAALCALGYASWAHLQLAGFVNVGASSSSALRSRVSLTATSAEVESALKEFKLQQWAANKLASEGSPLAAAAATRAQQAEAAYNAAKAAADGKPAPPMRAPVAVAAAPVATAAAPVSMGAVSDQQVAEAKKKMELLTWAAKTLASEGSPLAAAAATRAQQAEAAYNAAKAAADGKPAPPMPAPVAMAAAPVATAAAPYAMGAVSAEDLAEAKKQMELLTWAAKTLASQSSPSAAMIKAKADAAVAKYESMKNNGASVPAAAPMAAAPAPVAAAPVVAAPVAMPSGAASDAEIAEAKKAMELAVWAANTLVSSGSPMAATMQAKAQQATATYEALAASQKQMAR